MQSSHITAILIVLIVMIASIVRARYRADKREGGDRAIESGETQRLRDEVKALKERLQVLERITVEKENSLEREIERLRDQ
jgi:hypothetical protein